MDHEKEVRFDKWCESCEHKDESEFDGDSACYDCLYEPSNIDSTKPHGYKEAT